MKEHFWADLANLGSYKKVLLYSSTAVPVYFQVSKVNVNPSSMLQTCEGDLHAEISKIVQ